MSKIYRYILFLAIIAAAFVLIRQSAAAAPARLAPSPTPTPLGCLPVRQALNKKQIQIVLTGSGQLFYHKPIHYQITNLTGQVLVVCFPVGQELDPDDSSLQILMVIDAAPISVPAGGTVEGDLSAFCINETRHAPQTGDSYQVGKLAGGKLLDLAKTIDAESAQGNLGAEMAIWTITDQYSLDNLTSTPVPGQPSLTDSIEPLLCLAQDQITLGSKLLQDANTGTVLFHGANPLTSFCQQQGIPSLGQIGQRLKIAGIWAAVIVAASGLLCVVGIVLLIVLIVRMARKRK